MLDNLDPATRDVLDRAQRQARELHHRYLGTEHVLLGLALAGGPVADLLADRGCGPEAVRAEILDYIGEGDPRHRARELLASLGIDLAEVRRRAEANFGSEAVAQVALSTRPRRRHWPVVHRWWPGCDQGGPGSSALLDRDWLGLAPRLKHILDAARTTAAPAQATPHDLLAAILDEGKGVACRILVRRGVDLPELRAAVRSTPPPTA
jgi:Clp amino terminal domain, pathogenicity island component